MKKIDKTGPKNLKHQYVFCVEGKAEDYWLSFLKSFIKPKKCFRIENMGGFSTLNGFEGKYKKVTKTWDIRPKTAFSLIFIFDNDLGIESTKIQNFIISKGHNHFVTDPNIEGLFLKLKQKYNLTNDGTIQFREKCKHQFALQFKKKVDELGVRDKNYIEILGRDIGSIISNAKICPNYSALLKLFLEDND